MKKQQFGEANRLQPIFLQIQLDDGSIQIIKPQMDDNPIKVSQQFCKKYELEQDMIFVLAKNIEQTINKLKEKQVYKKITKQNVLQAVRIQNKTQQNDAQMTKIYKENQFKLIDQYSQRSRKMNINDKSNYQQKLARKKNKKSFNQSNSALETNWSMVSKKTKSNLYQIPKLSNKDFKQKKVQSNFQKVQANDSKHKKQLENFKISLHNQNPIFFQSKRSQPYSSIKTEPSYTKFNKIKNFEEVQNDSIIQQLSSNKIKSQIHKQKNKQFLNLRNFKFYQLVKNSDGNGFFYKRSQREHQSQNKQNKKRQQDQNTKRIQINSSISKLQNKNLINRQKQIISTNHNKEKSFSKKSLKNDSFHQIKTEKLYENKKQKAFQTIFQILDSDRDNKISILNINLIIMIEQKLIRILFPVLQQLQILQTELNLDQFCKTMHNLFKKLTTEQKGYIINYGKIIQKMQSNVLILQDKKIPRMTEVSKQIVDHSARKGVNVYQYSKLREQRKKQSLQRMRVEKEKSIMINCTFYPRVNKKKQFYF